MSRAGEAPDLGGTLAAASCPKKKVLVIGMGFGYPRHLTRWVASSGPARVLSDPGIHPGYTLLAKETGAAVSPLIAGALQAGLR